MPQQACTKQACTKKCFDSSIPSTAASYNAYCGTVPCNLQTFAVLMYGLHHCTAMQVDLIFCPTTGSTFNQIYGQVCLPDNCCCRCMLIHVQHCHKAFTLACRFMWAGWKVGQPSWPSEALRLLKTACRMSRLCGRALITCRACFPELKPTQARHIKTAPC